nr:tail fiber domain-containing protein [Chthoniobacterales bacterium]
MNLTNRFNSIYIRYPLRRVALLVAMAALFAGATRTALAVEPPPGGDYPKEVTALGDGALANDTPGPDNTGLGFHALFSVTSAGAANTAVGAYALGDTTTGSANAAVGYQALLGNTTGAFNVAIGQNALIANIAGGYNVAVGEEALQAHTTGFDNVAVGPGAMSLGTKGEYNVAIGSTAMAFANGNDNVAVGDGAMNMANGSFNVAVGQFAGLSFAGNTNIAIGHYAGQNVTGRGGNNIEIANQGSKKDSAVIRLGDPAVQKQIFVAGISGATVSGGAAVMVTSSGQLGVATSSARFKENIQPMKQASEAILSLKPVTFRYKKELDPEAIPQFGLVAEQVAKVDPDLVARDESG